MKLILVSIDIEMHKAWEAAFASVPNVEFHLGSILEVEADWYVSPANSFGFMDGGIDQVYLDEWGPMIQGRVQHGIKVFHSGELPVGQVMMAALPPSANAKYLAVAPTMRVPMRLPEDTINPYLAARAVFSCRNGENVTIAMPGLGTGVGHVSPGRCAAQVKAAYESVFWPDRPENWLKSVKSHESLVRATV